MATNFHLNRKQTWKIVGMQNYCEDEEVVINADSYDEEDQSFTFAAKVKDEAPDSVWEGLIVGESGWCIFEMDGEGNVTQEDEE